MQFRAKAPGSLMLLGEYAVLTGKPALVCAVNKWMTVTLTPRSDDKIEIESDLHGKYSTELSQLNIEKPFQFVLGTLKHYQPKLKRGCHLHIASEFSDKVGFGSSSAVTVAMLATLITWLNIRMSPFDLVRQGRQIIRQIQGVGSGADIAACTYGGIISYQAQPLTIEKLPHIHPITALYAGFKTPTAQAIKDVHQRFVAHSDVLRHLNNSIGQCSLSGMQAVRKEDWTKLGEIMNIQQGLMESLGVSMPVLREMIEDLRAIPNIKGAKISGAGLGDCVIGLGNLNDDYTYSGKHNGVERIPVEMTLQGVSCEKI